VDGLGELSGTARPAWRSFGARGVALIGFTLYGPGDPPGLRRSEEVRTDPSRTRAGAAGRVRRSGARAGTASGAVCAGSNPAGGAAQRHKFGLAAASITGELCFCREVSGEPGRPRGVGWAGCTAKDGAAGLAGRTESTSAIGRDIVQSGQDRVLIAAPSWAARGPGRCGPAFRGQGDRLRAGRTFPRTELLDGGEHVAQPQRLIGAPADQQRGRAARVDPHPGGAEVAAPVGWIPISECLVLPFLCRRRVAGTGVAYWDKEGAWGS